MPAKKPRAKPRVILRPHAPAKITRRPGRGILGRAFKSHPASASVGNPALFMSLGKSKIWGVRRRVGQSKSEGYSSHFRPGERVLQIHVDSHVREGRNVAVLINELRRRFPDLRAAGFTGIYGYSPNTALMEAFERALNRYNPERISVSEREADRARKYYRSRIRTHGFPEKYAKTPVTGLAIRIPDEPVHAQKPTVGGRRRAA